MRGMLLEKPGDPLRLFNETDGEWLGFLTAVTRKSLSLRVEKVDAEKNLIFVRGAVPGHTNALVRIRRAVRKSK